MSSAEAKAPPLLLSRRCPDMETNALAVLKKTDDLEEIVRAWVAGGSEHPHEAFRRNACRLGNARKPNGGIDVISDNCFAGCNITSKHAFNALAEKFFAKLGIAGRTGADCVLEVAGERHGQSSYFLCL